MAANAALFDIAAVRARFSALDRELAFFDGPAGTQTPDEVIEAVASYLRSSNANSGGAFETSRATDAVITDARLAAAEFLGCAPEEVVFGANMTTLNFMLTRSAAREFVAGDEIVVTRLDHDANISPWLELARDLDLVVRFADVRTEDCTLDLVDLESQLSSRTRVVAVPWAANSVGTVVDVERVVALAHQAGALAWIDAVHYAPHGPLDVDRAGADVLLCSAYKFFGPHLGLAFVRAELLERWRPYTVRPAGDPPGHRFETGTLQHELLAGLSAAIDYLRSLGWNAVVSRERALGARFLAGLPSNCRLYGLPTMEGRVPTFAVTVEGRTPREAAERLGERGIAVWHGNYYAVEIMERLGLPDGAVRVGIVHYNTEEEVDRLLAALADL